MIAMLASQAYCGDEGGLQIRCLNLDECKIMTISC